MIFNNHQHILAAPRPTSIQLYMTFPNPTSP